MAAASKTELLSVTETEFEKLRILIDALESDTALRHREDNTSIKDVIAHRAHWIELFLGWYHDGLAGKPVYFPAKGYKWSDLKRYNVALRDRQAHLTWADTISLLDANHQKLMALIHSLSNSQLYGSAMKGAKNAWTPGRWAEAAGASHYRSASKSIRACMRADVR